jgi:hypothetical protein
MSKPRGVGPAPTREINEGFIEFLAGVARLLMYAGAVALIIGAGFLIYTCVIFSGESPPSNIAQAENNIGIFDKFVLGGVLALGVSTTYLFWGESILAGIQLASAAFLYLSPLILSSAGIAKSDQKAVGLALEALSRGGLLLGLIGIGVLVVDLSVRAKTRSRQGWKLDQLRYGKGVKEEVDRHNVFMGKCWQLPFCRKFVRERCPIYHARRTCWKELTGCMCEEEVIRNAMEAKAIPKDALMAATYIPRNMKLTFEQKRERCKSCVIYNEHQKHKYKAALPLTLIAFAAIYLGLHPLLIKAVGGIIGTLDQLMGKALLRPGGSGQLEQPTAFKELLLVCLLIVGLAYMMKLLEYVIFKLKV